MRSEIPVCEIALPEYRVDVHHQNTVMSHE